MKRSWCNAASTLSRRWKASWEPQLAVSCKRASKVHRCRHGCLKIALFKAQAWHTHFFPQQLAASGNISLSLESPLPSLPLGACCCCLNCLSRIALRLLLPCFFLQAQFHRSLCVLSQCIHNSQKEWDVNFPAHPSNPSYPSAILQVASLHGRSKRIAKYIHNPHLILDTR